MKAGTKESVCPFNENSDHLNRQVCLLIKTGTKVKIITSNMTNPGESYNSERLHRYPRGKRRIVSHSKEKGKTHSEPKGGE